MDLPASLAPPVPGRKDGTQDEDPAEVPGSDHAADYAAVSPHGVLQLIYQYTKGIPRKNNNLCTACLLDGFLEEKAVIDEATVKKAALLFPVPAC